MKSHCILNISETGTNNVALNNCWHDYETKQILEQFPKYKWAMFLPKTPYHFTKNW